MDSIDIEIILKNHSVTPKTEIIKLCHVYLLAKTVQPGTVFREFSENNSIIFEEVQKIIICDSKIDAHINISEMRVNWYVYSLNENGPQNDNFEDESGNEISLATQWVLPSFEMKNLWESLIYDNEIKMNLLKYASTMMEFADRGIDSSIITCNRVILLHGPPGTGKTSLCKALAHKLSIRMQKRYNQGILVEINSHSLFSKWFSESGKLVTRMFSKIKEIVENSNILVCVLIDEVESLAHARDQCMSGNEPSDSIRVVNAVLTQIDQIKRYPNVIILATSNMTEAIDLAFVDRADVKQYLGLPSAEAIYQIYHSCLDELLKTGLIQSKLNSSNMRDLKTKRYVNQFTHNHVFEAAKHLLEISRMSVGLSGRALRKIPFLAHALFLEGGIVNLEEFFEAMEKAVNYEILQRKHFSK